jgi:hypothetical protein
MLEHKMDVAGMSSIFVSGAKSGDYQNSMNVENSEHLVLTQLLPKLHLLQCSPGETSNRDMEKGQDNCLAARKGNYLPRGSFQS